MSCKQKACFFGLLISGLVLLLLGGLLVYGFKIMIKKDVQKEEVIRRGSAAYHNWVQPPAPVSMQFFIFNVTNHAELILNPHAKIKLQQLGPYSYKEQRVKTSVEFSNDGRLVSYRDLHQYVFDADASTGDSTDQIWTLNLALVSISNMFRLSPWVVRALVAEAMKVEKDADLFVKHSVHDVIWGYEDPLLAKVKSLAKKFLNQNIDDKVGLFYGKNNSDDGLYVIYTGKGSSDELGAIRIWNNQSQLPFWSNKYGNDINGSDGTIFPPFVDKSKKLYFFSSDICRSIYAEYTQDHTVRGIRLLRFVPPQTLFEAFPGNPENAAFCTPDVRSCLPSGLLNLTNCQTQPVIASLPHFYQGDPLLRARFTGLSPSEDLHQTYIDVEPLTGAAMNVAKRLQVNLYVEPVEGFSQLSNWSKVVFPIVWINESASLTDSLATDVKHKLYRPVLITRIVQYSVLALGALLLVVAVAVGFLLLRNRTSQDDSSSLLPKSSD